MANVVTHPHLQVDFHRGSVTHSPSPLGFGFGPPIMAGWPSASPHSPQSLWNYPTNSQSSQIRVAKRRHEPDEESENKHARDDEMDRSPTPERPKRAAPKRARTTPVLPLTTKGENNKKENKPAAANDESDVDVGVLLGKSYARQLYFVILIGLQRVYPNSPFYPFFQHCSPHSHL